MRFFLLHSLEAFHIAFHTFRSYKLRAVLTALGIIIGIVSVSLMAAVVDGLGKAFEKSIASLGADVLYIEKTPWFGREDRTSYRNRREIKLEYLSVLERQAHSVLRVAPEIKTLTSAEHRGVTISNVQLIGTTDQLKDIAGFTISHGRFISEEEASNARPVCVVGSEVAEKLFGGVSPLGMEIKIDGIRYTVKGILEKQGRFLGVIDLDNRLIIPIKTFLDRYGSTSGLSIAVKVKSLEKIEETKEEIRTILRHVRRVSPGAPDDFAINQREEVVNTFRNVQGVIAMIGLFITGLSLFVGGIGVMNIMLVSVVERTREIGIRKAVGAKRSMILLQFLIEAVVICMIGGIVGFVLSIPLSLLISQFLPVRISLLLLIIALSVSSVVGITSGFMPAYRASNLDPFEALRYE